MARPAVEFSGNKRLLWIAQEWMSYADDLAEWAMEHLVNRRDVWSQYTVKDGRISVVMLPVKEKRKLGIDMVTTKKLVRHFSGLEPGHLIGLHSISDHSTCKWFAIDIDLHDESVANAAEIVEANWETAYAWSMRLRAMGLDPLLMDSNGVGGYHIWTLLDKEYPLADVYDFVDSIRADWQEMGLPRKPEIFPPKREVKPDDLPYTLRLPGRHHTRHHYTRIYNFEQDGRNEWLEGGEAIETMLSTRPGKLPKLKKGAKANASTKPAKTPRSAKPAAKKKPEPKRKPRVALDLDGVLAKYSGWRGYDQIGAPIEGALEFANELAKIADIVIYTSRCSKDTGGEYDPPLLTPGQLRIHVIEWLEKHGFPYTEVYIGQGKPRVAAFIDDRAIRCSPQADPEAFLNSLDMLRMILGRKSAKKKK